MKRQRGYIDLGFVAVFYVIGVIAAIAVLVALPWLGWWLWEHFDIVRVK